MISFLNLIRKLEKTMNEPKLFGSHTCRMCGLNYEFEDMYPADMSVCRNCVVKLKKEVQK